MSLQAFLRRKINTDELPTEYVVSKFFEIGHFPQFNPSDSSYSCSCPLCREGSTGIGNIKRCYYYPSTNVIYCYHCGWSSRPYKWILTAGGYTYNDIVNEICEDDYDFLDINNIIKGQNALFDEESQFDDGLPKNLVNLSDINQLKYYQNDEVVKDVINYINKRHLNCAINRPKEWFTSLEDGPHYGRLIIPFYDAYGKVLFYQSRDVTGESNIRYFSKQNGIKSVFNLMNIDYSKEHIFIFEGPFDSCFTKNGVAIGGITTGESNFTGIQEEQLTSIIDKKYIWVLDSQYLDNTAYEKSESLLKSGESVFIWPESIGKRYKDFNDICIDKNINEISNKFILDNTFSGLHGLLTLKQI